MEIFTSITGQELVAGIYDLWGGRREEGSGWGAHVYLWRIRFDVWQN